MIKEVVHSLSTWPLFYEYINDEDMERDLAFIRRSKKEARDVVRWFLAEVSFLIATRKIKPEDLKCKN